jgi:hypothetical protein
MDYAIVSTESRDIMLIATQAETEVIQFLIHQPTPEQIIAFHPSLEVADRFYGLVHAEREGMLTAEDQRELETFMYIEHMMRLMKAAAHKALQQKAS